MDKYNKKVDIQLQTLYSDIDKQYRQFKPQIDEQISKIKKEDNDKKKKEIIAVISGLIILNWANVKNIIDNSSVKIGTIAYEVYTRSNVLGTSFLISKTDIADTVSKAIKTRNKYVSYNKMMSANANKISNKVKNIILSGLEKSETNGQITKKITKQLNISKNRAKNIAKNETNYYRTNSQLIIGDAHEQKGGTISKRWVYTYRSKEHRTSHMEADGQIVHGVNAKFDVGGKQTIAPQHFGDLKEDINCKCTIEIKAI